MIDKVKLLIQQKKLQTTTPIKIQKDRHCNFTIGEKPKEGKKLRVSQGRGIKFDFQRGNIVKILNKNNMLIEISNTYVISIYML